MAKATKNTASMAEAGDVNAEKMKALDAALSQIEKAYGKGSVMRLGDSGTNMNVETIPTGSLSLDIALGHGGIPRGRIIEIYGPESSGKTTVALHMVAEVQKRGGIAGFIDAEHALDPVYAKNIGVDIDNLYISQPDNGEQALEICETMVRSGAVDIIIVDSVAALVPKAEIDGDMGDSHVGLQARLMSQALRKLTGVISKKKKKKNFINQLREKVGVMFGNPETTTGGRALKFYSSIRLDVRRIEAIRQQGGVVMQDFGNDICAAFLPIDKLGELEQNSHVLRMEANAPSELMNDTSAVILGADKAWNGDGPAAYSQAAPSLPQAFTGKGVCAAVMDVGFDFTHPAFRNPDGTSRIKWFWDPLTIDANNDMLGMIYSSPAEVLAAQHSCDAILDKHGTHVMGSMAGAGLNGRYVGMAPEADILGVHMAMGGNTPLPNEYWDRLADYLKSHLSNYPGFEDAFIKIQPTSVNDLVGLHEVFKVADAAGQPCVVNWSFGRAPDFNLDRRLY